ncbi:extracellular matrix regulator RemB [Haliovirga abyssi]|uniref:DUF370 domain-containing protein n=1 Tax=Haliovirga abyssi TaxID=2996794 RepID=A0AAU9D0E9_9FUSO|nr:DUF370 domain-containing protein [Haliovirga abyssi]BDU49436.1 hypothetical protein HLVA_00050 [Haliovirga abyssi]
MYIYLENNFFIPLNEIIAIVDYEKFTESENGKDFFEINKKNIINISKNKKSMVITDTYSYVSSYRLRALYSRGKEFERLKTGKVK